MSEQEKVYILSIDDTLKALSQFNCWEKSKYFSKDILGQDWLSHYEDISSEDTYYCISKLEEELERIGDTSWCDIPFSN